jgi:Bifunctional DNA primase/polymerase, N-terminal
MVDAVLDLLVSGWHLLPVERDSKRPAGGLGLHHASNDPNVVLAWFRRWLGAGVAVACQRSGLLVIDGDVRNGADLGALHRAGDMPATYTVRTPGGMHWYFRHPGCDVRGALDRFPGYDIKSNGYAITAPTVRADGGRYVLVADDEPAPLPDWLLDLVRKPAPVVVPHAPVRSGSLYARAGLEREARTVATTPQGGGLRGGRNKQLNASVFAVARFCVDGDLGVGDVVATFTDAARTAGLEPDEIDNTIKSAFRGRGIQL